MLPAYVKNPIANYSGTYTDEPTFYTRFGVIYMFVGLPVFVFGLYCIWKKTPRETTKTFIYLYTLLISLSMLTHILECAVQPRIIAPYLIAGTTSGILTYLPGSSNLKIAALFGIGTGAIGPVGMLFYYRINLLLPFGHFLTRKWLKLILHSIMCFIGYVIGGTLFFLGEEDQDYVKKLLFEETGYVTDFFWNEKTVVYYMGFTPRCIIFLTAYGIGCCAVFSGTAAVTYSIMHLLRSKSNTMSKKTADLHWVLTKTLLAQIAVYGFVMATPVCIGTVMLILKIPRSGVLLWLFAIRSISSASGVLTMILVNKTYRRFLFSFFKKPKNEVLVISTVPNSIVSQSRNTVQTMTNTRIK